MASIVVTCAPETAETGSTQDRVGVPFKCTVHAPHWAMPQPNLVPVKLKSSRSTHRRGLSVDALVLTALPFSVKPIILVSTLSFAANIA